MLGVHDRNKELAGSKIGTIISILNWTQCISTENGETSINPEKILEVSLANGLIANSELQLAYSVARQIRKVVPLLGEHKTRKQSIGLMSLDTGYDYFRVRDVSYTAIERTEYTANKVIYPTTGTYSFGFTAGIALEASGTIPSSIFSCSINVSSTTSLTFSHTWGATKPGHICWPYKDAVYRYHEHVWDIWYWYIDSPGGPKNYIYCGQGYSFSRELLYNLWGQIERPL